MDDPAMLLLRFLHIAAGVFWVGAAVTAFAFVEPAAHDLGDDGRRYVAQLTKRRRFPEFVTATAVVILVAGGVLYWRVSGGFQAGWILGPMGMGFHDRGDSRNRRRCGRGGLHPSHPETAGGGRQGRIHDAHAGRAGIFVTVDTGTPMVATAGSSAGERRLAPTAD